MKMYRKPWGMTEGVLVCCGWVAVGVFLQWLVGPVCWELMSWPVNAIVLVVLLLCILLIYMLRGRFRLFRWMATLQAAVPAIMACALLTILMGVTRQVPSGHMPADPFGITDMLSFWPFVLSFFWLMVLVGLVCVTRLCRPTWRSVPFLLNHLGIFLALVAGTLGHADMKQLRMIVQEGKTEFRAIDARHSMYELPIAIELHDFFIQEDPELSYMSDVTVRTRSGISVRDTIRVNKPLSVRGWKIYQYSYDEAMGGQSEYSVFELVRDPWLPFVYAGIFMMLVGAACQWLSKDPLASFRGNK